MSLLHNTHSKYLLSCFAPDAPFAPPAVLKDDVRFRRASGESSRIARSLPPRERPMRRAVSRCRNPEVRSRRRAQLLAHGQVSSDAPTSTARVLARITSLVTGGLVVSGRRVDLRQKGSLGPHKCLKVLP